VYLHPFSTKIGPKHIDATTLTSWGDVTSLAASPFDSPGAVSYRCSVEMVSVSLATNVCNEQEIS